MFVFFKMSDSESDIGPSSAKKVKRSFTIDKKLEIIAYAKKHSNHKASRDFNIGRSTIQGWIPKEDEFLKMKK